MYSEIYINKLIEQKRKNDHFFSRVEKKPGVGILWDIRIC